jgi:hypothetical protein
MVLKQCSEGIFFNNLIDYMRKFYLLFLYFSLVLAGFLSFSVQSNDFSGEDNCPGVSAPSGILSFSYHAVHNAVCCSGQPVAFQQCVNDASLLCKFKCNFYEPGVDASMRYPVSQFFPQLKSGISSAFQADALPFFISEEWFKVGDFYTGRIFTDKHETGLNNKLMNWTVSLFEGMLEIYFEKASLSDNLAFESRGKQPANIVHINDPNASAFQDGCIKGVACKPTNGLQSGIPLNCFKS